MPNWGAGIFCGEKFDVLKFKIDFIKCPIEKCKFRVLGTSEDPIGEIHRHFSAKKPHGAIGVLHCCACHKNFENKTCLSIHCQLGHEKLDIGQAQGAILIDKGKLVQANKAAPPKKVEPNKPYVCFVCKQKETHQSLVTTHFHQCHRLGHFTCNVADCVKKDVIYDNMYYAALHYNTDHVDKKKAPKNDGVKRKC